MKKILYNSKTKKIMIILVILFVTICTTRIPHVEAALTEAVIGKGQVSDFTYMLDGTPIYTYLTKGGGYIDYIEGNDDYHIYQAEPRNGWKFIKWATYCKTPVVEAQNTTIGLGNDYYFSRPNDTTVEFNKEALQIRINDGYAKEYRLYAVFEPIITGTVDEHGEISTSYTYNGKLTNKIELPVSYGENSETIRIESKEQGYEINTIKVNGTNIDINDEDRDLYFYIFKQVTNPQSIDATFRPVVYKITFNGNGSTGGDMATQQFSYGTAQKLTENAFSKEGYVFSGWNTNSDGLGTSYTDAQEVNNLTTESAQTITLYAQWIPADLTGTVTITGEEKLGKTLTVSVENTNNTGELYYQWQRDGEDIVNATGKEYTLTQDDVNKKISCVVTSSVQRNLISDTTDVIGDNYAVSYNLTNITTDGELTAKIGEDYITTLLPEKKYKLPESILVKVGELELSSDRYSYDYETSTLTIPANEITDDIEIIATAIELGPLELFEDSKNQEFVIGIDEDLTFLLDNDRGNGKVYVDDKELSQENGDYVWHFLEGIYPTIILSEDYMKTLEVGEYTIKFVLDDGRECETIFTITEPGMDDEGTIIIEGTRDEGINNEEITTDTNSNNPATGDNIAIYFTIFIVSILVIGVIILIKNKRQK